MDRKILEEEWRQEAEQMENEMSALLFKFQRYSTEMTSELAQAHLEQEQAQAKLEQVQAELVQAKAEIQALKLKLTYPELAEPTVSKKPVTSVEPAVFAASETSSEPSQKENSVKIAPSVQAVPSVGAVQLGTSHDLRRIQDLRKAIGLNDRFRFRHDLFQDDDALMWATIDALNALETLQQAQDYLQSHFSWEADDDTVVYFYEMLGRKFYR